jgi:pimeloyl-ACP methyl ester carboxylesterase
MEKKIFLNNLSLTKVQNGTRGNIVLFPGGAGIYGHYLIDVFKRLKTNHNLWLAEFHLSNISPEKLIESWADSICAIHERIKNPIMFGHSFGGMFLQSIDFKPLQCQKIIVCGASPTNNWADLVKDEWSKIDSPRYLKAEKNYKENRTDENLRLLFMAWSDFYFLKSHHDLGKILLSKDYYNYQLYEFCNKHFFPSYQSKWKNLENKLLIFGENDIVTSPLSVPLFYSDSILNTKNFKIIPRAGHFPWDENFLGFKITIDLNLK